MRETCIHSFHGKGQSVSTWASGGYSPEGFGDRELTPHGRHRT